MPELGNGPRPEIVRALNETGVEVVLNTSPRQRVSVDGNAERRHRHRHVHHRVDSRDARQ